jgi:hypothetical protein
MSELRRVTFYFSADLIKALKELESGEGDIEQRITIVPNPRAKRRGSMASYAFPELHSRQLQNSFLAESFFHPLHT